MRILSLTPGNFQDSVQAAAQALRKGGVVVAPTDTVYGLLADAANENAVKMVYAVKNRPSVKPLPIFVKNMAMAKKIAAMSPRQRQILETKWPGKFTAVLRQRSGAKIYGTDGNTVALRIPFHRFVNSLLETLDSPVSGTSANISGRPAATNIDDVLQQFSGRRFLPDLVINAGDLPPSSPSTIVDLTGAEQKVIRP